MAQTTTQTKLIAPLDTFYTQTTSESPYWWLPLTLVLLFAIFWWRVFLYRYRIFGRAPAKKRLYLYKLHPDSLNRTWQARLWKQTFSNANGQFQVNACPGHFLLSPERLAKTANLNIPDPILLTHYRHTHRHDFKLAGPDLPPLLTTVKKLSS